MSQRPIRAASGFFELFMRDRSFRAGLQASIARLKAAGRAVAGVGRSFLISGALLAAPLVLAAKKFANVGDTIDKTAQRTGVGERALSELGFAAEQSGTNLAAVEKGFFGLSRTLFDLERGGAASVDAFNALGLTLDDVAGKNPEEQFLIVADSLSKVEDASRRGAIAQQIFGRSGRQLLPLIQQGASGIAELRTEAQRLGLSIGPEQAKSAAVLTDAWNRVTRTFQGLFFVVGGALAPAFSKVSDAIAAINAKAIEFIQNNGSYIRMAALVVGGVIATGVALLTLGGILTLTGFALGGMVTLFSVLASAVSFVLSPIGLVIGLLAGLTVALLRYTSIGGTVVDFLKDKFGELTSFFSQSLGAMGRALAAGDLAQAANVLWASLRAAWVSGIGFLNRQWQEWKGFFREVFNQAVFGLLELWTNVTSRFSEFWTSTVASLALGWESFRNSGVNAWRSAQTFIAGGILRLRGMLDETFDTDGALATLQQDANRQRAARDEQSAAALAKIAEEEKKRLDEIRSLRDRDLANLGAARDEKTASILAEQDAAIAASQAERDRAIREWKQAVQDAENLPAAKAGKGLSSVLDTLQNGEALSRLTSGVNQVKPQGTFSGVAAARIFGDAGFEQKKLDELKRIKDAANRTADGIANIVFPQFG